MRRRESVGDLAGPGPRSRASGSDCECRVGLARDSYKTSLGAAVRMSAGLLGGDGARVGGLSLQHDVPLGFVLVDDPEDAEFHAAKIVLARTRIVAGDDAVVDAVHGFCGKPDGLEVARPERLNAVLTSPWRLLAIGGHSDLGHVSMGSHVICGAAGPERVGGQSLVDGCDPANRRCRRRLGFQRTAVPAASLRAAVLALMGCNSFDLTAGEYPSTNSLCASALSGQPVAVIGTLGRLYADFDAVGLFARSVAEGPSLALLSSGLTARTRSPLATV